MVWSTSMFIIISLITYIYSKLTSAPIAAARGALYADVRAYCSHIMLSSLPRLFYFLFFIFTLNNKHLITGSEGNS